MDHQAKARLRTFLQGLLDGHGDRRAFTDDDSLFVSGRLDSLSMMSLIVHLEESFGIDFAQVAFDVDRIDTVADIEAFVNVTPRA
jgi:acyl carrier protein